MAPAPRRAKVVPLPASAPEILHPPFLEAEDGLRVLALALQGLESRAREESLDSKHVITEVGALLALVYDIQDSLERGAA